VGCSAEANAKDRLGGVWFAVERNSFRGVKKKKIQCYYKYAFGNNAIIIERYYLNASEIKYINK